VLSRAMAAAKPVIVSDEQLLGRLTREHRIGLLFPSGNAAALREKLAEATKFSREDAALFAAAAKRYAEIYSRTAFRSALLHSLANS